MIISFVYYDVITELITTKCLIINSFIRVKFVTFFDLIKKSMW